MSEAARQAGIARRTAYEWKDTNAAFKADWDEAEQIAIDALEMVARDRAKSGQSDRMLEILLKAHRPDKYVERRQVELTTNLGAELEAARKRTSE